MHTEINRPKINTPADADSFDNPLIRELQVLRDGVAIGFSQRVEEAKKNPGGAITEGAVAVAAGALMTAGMLTGGRAAVASRVAGSVFGLGFAIDAGTRVVNSVDAAKLVWMSPNATNRATKIVADNLGTAAFDYSLMALGGAIGSGGAFISKGTFKAVPAKVAEAPRQFAAPESVKTQREAKVTEDVRQLYEASFPVEERQPTDAIAALVEKGRVRVDTTRDADGTLKAYSFVSFHDENPAYMFAHLDYMATQPKLRSHGIGSLHVKRLNETLRKENPDFVALTLEMEDPRAAGLTAEAVSMREFRSKFYERQGARNTLPGHVNAKGKYVPGYRILDFELIADPKTWSAKIDNQPAEWRAFVFKPEKYDALKSALNFYRGEGGYGLKNSHPAVRHLLRLHGKNMKWLNNLDKGA
jgi:hypothetical protein